jgi:AraC-like DNA-binding protein
MSRRSQQEQARIWRDPHIQGMELLDATFTTHSFPKHSHASYGIGLSQNGTGVVNARGMQHLAPPNHLIFLHPDEVHWGHADREEAWTYRMIYLDVEVVRDVLDGDARTLSFPQTTFQDALLAASFLQLHQSFSAPASILERDTVLHHFVHVLRQQAGGCRAAQPTGFDRRAVQLVRDFLEANYHEDVSIQALAELTNISPSYLVTLFRQAIGLPPHRYQMQVRVHHAKQALCTQTPLHQIALDLGFYDQSHFNRWFKRLVGVSPLAYRKSNRSNFVQDNPPSEPVL